jgi:hypothetical protein
MAELRQPTDHMSAGSKRAAVAPPSGERWGICKPRTASRASGAGRGPAKPTGLPTGFINFPPDPAAAPGGPHYRRVSNGDEGLTGQPMPGDQTFLFGAVGQPSLREVPARDQWLCMQTFPC